MADKRLKKYLFDILESIEFIESVMPEIRNFSDYQRNKFYRPSFERKIEIIGEAVNQANKIDPALNISNKERIIGMRNRIIHAYDAVDDALIWEVVRKHLPVLKKEIEALLGG